MNDSCKYFFNKSMELLHRKSFDTYRVNLHNPYTIFVELNKSIEKYNKKRIKNFDPTITSIVQEATGFLQNCYLDCVFSFGTFGRKQAVTILDNTTKSDKDGKKNRTLSLLCKSIEVENKEFKKNLFVKIKSLLVTDDKANFEQIDLYTSWLVTQLIHQGYSRKFIIDRIRKSKTFLDNNSTIEIVFSKLNTVFDNNRDDYEAIFKIKPNSADTLLIASNQINELDAFPKEFENKRYISERFKEISEGEKYLSVIINSLDFWSALRTTYLLVTETVEINCLHDIDNKITLDKQALIIHCSSRSYRMESIEENLDGFYDYQESDFVRFVENFKALNGRSNVAYEKIRSAIRFYKLGNDSQEIEHKILNYWIGFEQLFSAIDTEEDSINRMKSFFIAINAVYYWQRRTTYLLNRAGVNYSFDNFTNSQLPVDPHPNPQIQHRLEKYVVLLNDKKELRGSIEKHIKRLNQHLTRIYRVRNELVHEGRTSVDLFLIAGHLRHYLLFSIEQITNELIENQTLGCLDDVFVYFENILERIKDANNIKEIFEIKKYTGYME